jgi:hypothetical protein
MKINQYGMMEWDGFEPFFNDSEAILPQRRDRRCDGDDFLKPANPLKEVEVCPRRSFWSHRRLASQC